MANKDLGARLQKLRKEKGYTQQEAADILGLKNKTTLASWEYGKSEPDIITFLKLGDVYGNDIFREEFFPWLNGDEFIFSSSEQKHIKTYRKLDTHGKNNVDMLLQNEYNRCKQTNVSTQPPKADEDEYQPETIAAHYDGKPTAAFKRDVDKVKQLSKMKRDAQRRGE